MISFTQGNHAVARSRFVRTAKKRKGQIQTCGCIIYQAFYISTTVCYCYAQEAGEFRVSAGTNRKVLLVDDLDFTAHSSGIPLLGNLSLDQRWKKRWLHTEQGLRLRFRFATTSRYVELHTGCDSRFREAFFQSLTVNGWVKIGLTFTGRLAGPNNWSQVWVNFAC